MHELTPDEMVSDLLADIEIKLDAVPGLDGRLVREIMDAIAPTIEARIILERRYPTTSDWQFGIINTKNGGELLATFGVDGSVLPGDTITLPAFKLKLDR